MKNLGNKDYGRFPTVFAEYKDAISGKIKPIPREGFLEFEGKDAYLYDIYTVIPLDDEGAPIRELTEKEKEINAKIENVSSFNVSVYTIIRTENKVTGGITDYEISPAYYENISVNDYFLKRPNTKAPKP